MNLNHAYRAAAFSVLAAAMSGGIPACNKTCSDCGTVNAVHDVKDEGHASGAGAAGGAIVGGVLGHQTGSGRGKDAMTVVGAVGGALAGNYAEKQLRASHHYEVVVRFNDGSTQTFRFQDKPSFQVGDHVKKNGGSLVME